MKQFYIIIILLAAFGAAALSAAETSGTPHEYADVENNLKKKYKKVVFKDKFFIVGDKDLKGYALASLSGEVFTPTKQLINEAEQIQLIELCGTPYLRLRDYEGYDFRENKQKFSKSRLFSLDGKLVFEIGDLEEFPVGDKVFLKSKDTLYDSDFKEIWKIPGPVLTVKHITGMDFLEVSHPQPYDPKGADCNKELYSVSLNLIKSGYQWVEGSKVDGVEAMVFTMPNNLSLAFHFNPSDGSLIPVALDTNQIIELNGKTYYLFKASRYETPKIYGLDGTLITDKQIFQVKPSHLLIDRGKGAMNNDFKVIVPSDKWTSFSYKEENGYGWFEVVNENNFTESERRQFRDGCFTHIINLSGQVYELGEPARSVHVSKNGLIYKPVHADGSDMPEKQITGASLAAFAINSPKTDAQPGKAPAHTPANSDLAMTAAPTPKAETEEKHQPRPKAKKETITVTRVQENRKQEAPAKSTPKNTTGNTAPKTFPSLEIEEGSLCFIDASGRNSINPDMQYAIEFTVRNVGTGKATGCKPLVALRTDNPGIRIGQLPAITLEAGASTKISVPINSSMAVAEGTAEFAVQVDEPMGFGTEENVLSVNTHAYEAPRVLVNDYTVTSQGGSVLKKKTPFDVQLLIQNVSHGQAEDVSVTIHLPDNIFVLEGNTESVFESLHGGQTEELLFTLIANNNYSAETIPIKIELHEKQGKYAENREIDLQFNQPLMASRIVVDESPQSRKGEIEVARLNSDVDVAIPAGTKKADNTFVVIIGNENYTQVAPVPFAANDAGIFAEYCRTTLGIPQRNIRMVTNATLNEIKRNVGWLSQVGETFADQANLIFYYSGHGIPDESTGSAHLLPIDGYHSDMSTNYRVDELYEILNSSGAGRIIVFMDACFSGSRRGDGMLMAARAVQIKAKTQVPKGNMIVFSAAQGDETAYPYESQKHGLFTYYLLKKLKETSGDVSLGELSTFITDQVKKISLLENSKLQTPEVQISPALVNTWRNLPL